VHREELDGGEVSAEWEKLGDYKREILIDYVTSDPQYTRQSAGNLLDLFGPPDEDAAEIEAAEEKLEALRERAATRIALMFEGDLSREMEAESVREWLLVLRKLFALVPLFRTYSYVDTDSFESFGAALDGVRQTMDQLTRALFPPIPAMKILSALDTAPPKNFAIGIGVDVPVVDLADPGCGEQLRLLIQNRVPKTVPRALLINHDDRSRDGVYEFVDWTWRPSTAEAASSSSWIKGIT
jgi:hypothetical protein